MGHVFEKTKAIADRDLLQLLADGKFHSGQKLAAQLGMSRAAVWKCINSLTRLQIEIEAVRGKGYRLPYPIEFLERTRIDATLSDTCRELLAPLQILQETDSTNRQLVTRIGREDIHGQVCLAEFQTGGRGRQNREWVAPFAGGVCLSLGWRFNVGLEALAALSLGVAIAVVRALRSVGLTERLGIKWPNDLLHDGRKLAGILLELQSETAGGSHVVIGIGLNVDLPATVGRHVDQPATDLHTALGFRPSRNELVGVILNELCNLLIGYDRGGFRALLDDWHTYDLIDGQTVTVTSPHGTVTGIARGVDDHGALLVETDGSINRYYAGDVSVRST